MLCELYLYLPSITNVIQRQKMNQTASHVFIAEWQEILPVKKGDF